MFVDGKNILFIANDVFLCRPEAIFAGENHIHFGEGLENYVTLPVIPPLN